MHDRGAQYVAAQEYWLVEQHDSNMDDNVWLSVYDCRADASAVGFKAPVEVYVYSARVYYGWVADCSLGSCRGRLAGVAWNSVVRIKWF